MPDSYPFSRRSLLVRSLPMVYAARAVSQVNPGNLPGSRVPDSVWVYSESGRANLTRQGERWTASGLEVQTSASGESLQVLLSASQLPVLRLRLRWFMKTSSSTRFLGDAWERTYGDIGWQGMDPDRIYPWYLLAYDGRTTTSFGVKTQAAAFCCWQMDPDGLSLWLDVRNGGGGVALGTRVLHAADVISAVYSDTSPFAAACQFCRRMAGPPRLPVQPVYGGNNWYYAYGKSSADAIRDDSRRVADWAHSNRNRPFMVIDDGWEPHPVAGPFSTGNERFPSMPQLAADMRTAGVKPGVWVRPLYTRETVAESWRLRSPNADAEVRKNQTFTLDPTVPEAAEHIASTIHTVTGWGYDLVKHDFLTYDLFGRWGFRMGFELTDPGWHFADRSRTNAEITRDFYLLLRNAAGEKLLLGCNTVAHLSAGIFEISRTGDDTSGRDWNRTRKMGVNTLAFRAPQHGSFYAVDADCVGLTETIPWSFNHQWLDLLAHSGTPLFVSAAPGAVGPEQRAAIERAFAIASEPQPLIEPLDWLSTTEPCRWKAGSGQLDFDWFGADGAAPESLLEAV